MIQKGVGKRYQAKINSAEKACLISDLKEFRGKHDLKKQSFILYTDKRKNRWRYIYVYIYIKQISFIYRNINIYTSQYKHIYLTRHLKNMYRNATTNRNKRRNKDKSTILIGDYNISFSEADWLRDWKNKDNRIFE